MNALLNVASHVEAATASYNLLAGPLPTRRHGDAASRKRGPNSPKRSHISCHLVGNSGGKLLSHGAAEAQSAAPRRPLPRIRLLLPTQLPVPLVAVENVSMEVDELAGDDYVP
ncbi:hypothetical protein EI94DRAFT_1708920, partial [Lactarius quietus]